jgi:hypothetical protein
MAMAHHTLHWLSNQGFNDAEFLMNAVENYIKSNTNILIKNIKLLMLRKKLDESNEHFVKKNQRKSQVL